jgi:hypothetical protein
MISTDFEGYLSWAKEVPVIPKRTTIAIIKIAHFFILSLLVEKL